MAKVFNVGTVYTQGQALPEQDASALSNLVNDNPNLSADAAIALYKNPELAGTYSNEQQMLLDEQNKANYQKIKEKNMSFAEHVPRAITKAGFAVLDYVPDVINNVIGHSTGWITGEHETPDKWWASAADVFGSGTTAGQLIGQTTQFLSGQQKDLNTGGDFFVTDESAIQQEKFKAQANAYGWDTINEYGDRTNLGSVIAGQAFKLQKGSDISNAVSTAADMLGLATSFITLGELSAPIKALTTGVKWLGKSAAVTAGITKAGKGISEARAAQLASTEATKGLEASLSEAKALHGSAPIDVLTDVTSEGGQPIAHLVNEQKLLQSDKAVNEIPVKQNAITDAIQSETKQNQYLTNAADDMISKLEVKKMELEAHVARVETNSVSRVTQLDNEAEQLTKRSNELTSDTTWKTAKDADVKQIELNTIAARLESIKAERQIIDGHKVPTTKAEHLDNTNNLTYTDTIVHEGALTAHEQIQKITEMQQVLRTGKENLIKEAVGKAKAISEKYGISPDGTIKTYEDAQSFFNDVVGLHKGVDDNYMFNINKALNWATNGGMNGISDAILEINKVNPDKAFNRIMQLTRGKLDIETMLALSKATSTNEVKSIFIDALSQGKLSANIGKMRLVKAYSRILDSNGEIRTIQSYDKAYAAALNNISIRTLVWGKTKIDTLVPWARAHDTRDQEGMVYGLSDMIEFSAGTFGIPLSEVKYVRKQFAKLIPSKVTSGADGKEWRDFKDYYVSKMANAKTSEERYQIWYQVQNHMIEMSASAHGLDKAQVTLLKNAFKASHAAQKDMISRMAELNAKENASKLADDLGMDVNTIGLEAIIYDFNMNHTVGMINPYEMRKMLETGKTISQIKESAGIPGQVKAWYTQTMVNVFDNFFRRAVLFRLGYVARNVLETQGRMFLTGHPNFLSNPALLLSLPFNKEYDNIVKTSIARISKGELDASGKRFDATLEDANDKQLLAQTIAHSSMNKGRMTDPGALKNDKAFASGKGFENVTLDHADFAAGHAEYVYRISTSPIAKNVLSAMASRELDDNIKAFVKENKLEDVSIQDQVIDYYWYGKGIEEIDNLRRAQKGVHAEMYNTREKLAEYLFGNSETSVKNLVDSFTDGYNEKFIDIILDSKFTKINKDGEEEVIRYSKGLNDKEATKPFNYQEQVKEIKNAYSEVIDGYKTVPENAKVLSVPKSRIDFEYSKKDVVNIFETLSDGIYSWSSKSENIFATIPEFKYAHWDYVSKMILALSPEDAAKVVSNAERTLGKTGIPGTWAGITLRTIKSNAKKAIGDGTYTVDDIVLAANRDASRKVAELFYDASKRNAFAHALRYISPFGQAWANSMRTWGKLALQNPLQVYKAEVFLKSLESEGSGWIYNITGQDEYDAKAPFIYSDPKTGKKVFGIPAVGALSGLLAGQGTNAYGATMDVGSLNLLFQNGMWPGFGPLVQIPMSALESNTDFMKIMPDWLVTAINPYIKDPNQAFSLEGTLLPSWSKEALAGLTNGALFPEVRNKYIPGAMASLMQSQPEKYLNENGFLDTDGQNRLLEDAQKVSAGLSIARGLTQIWAPGSTKTEAKIQDKNGESHLMTVIGAEFTDLMNQGLDQGEAMGKLVDTYGMNAFMSMVTTSRSGYTPTDEAWQAIKEHPELLDNQGSVLSLFYVNGGYSAMLASQQTSGSKKLSNTEIISQVNQSKYIARQGQLDYKLATGEIDSTSYDTQLAKLKEDYSTVPKPAGDLGWRDVQIQEIGEALKDPTLSQTKVGQSASYYLTARDEALSFGVGLDAKSNYDNRMNLYNIGSKLASENPAFSVMWFRVLRKEVAPTQ